MTAVTVPFRLLGNSIVLRGEVNGQEAEFILDTGDAVGPVFNGSDLMAYALESAGPIGVSGAGGAVDVYRTYADVTLGGVTFKREAGAIDLQLQGISLLGLPFFLAKTDALLFDFDAYALTFVVADGDEVTEMAQAA